jgi:hypothetical protein
LNRRLIDVQLFAMSDPTTTLVKSVPVRISKSCERKGNKAVEHLTTTVAKQLIKQASSQCNMSAPQVFVPYYIKATTRCGCYCWSIAIDVLQPAAILTCNGDWILQSTAYGNIG